MEEKQPQNCYLIELISLYVSLRINQNANEIVLSSFAVSEFLLIENNNK